MKLVKAVASCGKVREYKPLSRWELPDYLRKHLARLGKQIDSRALDLLLMLCGEQLGALVNEAKKLLFLWENEKESKKMIFYGWCPAALK